MSKLDDILIDLDAGDRSVEETKQELIKLVEEFVFPKREYIDKTEDNHFAYGWNAYRKDIKNKIKELKGEVIK